MNILNTQRTKFQSKLTEKNQLKPNSDPKTTLSNEEIQSRRYKKI